MNTTHMYTHRTYLQTHHTHTQITVLHPYNKCYETNTSPLKGVGICVCWYLQKDGLVIVGFQSKFLLFKLFHLAWGQALNRSIFIIVDKWAPRPERKKTGIKQIFAHFLFLGLAHKGPVGLHIF